MWSHYYTQSMVIVRMVSFPVKFNCYQVYKSVDKAINLNIVTYAISPAM